MQGYITTDMDRLETGLAKLEQLEVLLASLSGPGLATFVDLAGRLQEQLMMLAVDLARDARCALVQDESG